MKPRIPLLALLALGAISALGFAQVPVPFISQPLVPDSATPGSAQFTLTLSGTGFVSGSVVDWNGAPPHHHVRQRYTGDGDCAGG
jgi:hypothetical protein